MYHNRHVTIYIHIFRMQCHSMIRNTLCKIHPIISQAEETIRSHTGTPDTHTQPRPSRHLVIGKDGNPYPMNPTTNCISCFADGFRGCLGCGSVSHLFHECPEKHNKTMKFNFFRIWMLTRLARKETMIHQQVNLIIFLLNPLLLFLLLLTHSLTTHQLNEHVLC